MRLINPDRTKNWRIWRCSVNKAIVSNSAPTSLCLCLYFCHLASISKAKVHMNECCECVWKSSLVHGPPSQTQQGAGGADKKNTGHTFHSFSGLHKHFDSDSWLVEKVLNVNMGKAGVFPVCVCRWRIGIVHLCPKNVHWLAHNNSQDSELKTWRKDQAFTCLFTLKFNFSCLLR